jgi:hypothetical protein
MGRKHRGDSCSDSDDSDFEDFLKKVYKKEGVIMVGGSGSSDATGSGAGTARYALTEDDLRKLLGGDVPIHRYPDLEDMNSPKDLFKGKGMAILLFLTENKNEGHWLAVLDHPDHYEVFDSYGTAIDGDRKWLTKSELERFDQTAPLLKDLLSKGNKPMTHNTTKLQKDDADTCGRWVAARLLNKQVPLKTFVAKMTGNGRSPDENVFEYTFNLLHK